MYKSLFDKHNDLDDITKIFLIAISKIFCGPLWRIVQDESVSFFKMNEYWQVLVEKFEEFSNDPTALLRGEPIFNTESIINKDPVYKSLFDKHNDLDDITKIILIAISKQICPMLKRQLSDQLPGVKFYIPSEELKMQCSPVPKTKRISEADFSALDRLERNAPKKSTVAKTGIINYTLYKQQNKQLLETNFH